VVTTGHLLIGIVDTHDRSRRLLAAFGAAPDVIRRKLAEFLPPGPQSTREEGPPPMSRLGLIIFRESAPQRAGGATVEIPHVLLAVSAEPDCLARAMLTSLNIDHTALTREFR
jgi:ATP-dependent Clp protease ATP-binding subunit ClpA